VRRKLWGQFLAFAGAFLLVGGPCWLRGGRFAFLAGVAFLAAGVYLAPPWAAGEGGKPAKE
jgi:hypothetical protein